MVKDNFSKFIRSKGFYLAIGVCALAILAVAGIVNYQSKQQEQQLAENAAGFEDAPEESKNSNAVADHRTKDNDHDLDYTEGYNADQIQDILNSLEESAAAAANAQAVGENQAQSERDTTQETGSSWDQASEQTGDSAAAGFDEHQKMSWPLQGEIILDYSMDTTIYYKTLDQYKCNPGILIDADVNTPVNAAFDGTVVSVENDASLGNTVTVDMGNGYTAVYGQLKDVPVKAGDAVVKGQALGSIAQPTKYFTQEGAHLNFQLKKDDQPIDPKAYME